MLLPGLYQRQQMGVGVDVMTNEQAARILDPATSLDALAPYAQDGQMRLAVTEEACRVAAEALRPWRDAGIEVPADDHDVLVLVSGQYGNITFEHAPMLGHGWSRKAGISTSIPCGISPACPTGWRSRSRRRRQRDEVSYVQS